MKRRVEAMREQLGLAAERLRRDGRAMYHALPAVRVRRQM